MKNACFTLRLLAAVERETRRLADLYRGLPRAWSHDRKTYRMRRLAKYLARRLERA